MWYQPQMPSVKGDFMMGQQHPQSGKGVGISSFVTSTSDTNPDNVFSANPNGGQDHVPSSNPPSTINSASGVEQAQSVRAAIDSFIETCLAGSDEGPPTHRQAPGHHTPNSVEVITVPDEDESDGASVDSVHQGRSGGSLDKDKSNTKMGEGHQTKDDIPSDKSVEGAPKRKTESTPVSIGSNVGASSGEKLDKNFSPQNQSVSVPNKEPGTDSIETNSVLSSKPTQSATRASEKTGNTSCTSANLTSHTNDSSTEGVESMRLKTIIDRMLDSSLGVGEELSSLPVEQRILPQIVADKCSEALRMASQHSEKATNSEVTVNKAGVDASVAPERAVDPMAICFMEHIEKAVERSFSSITEEEERKEKGLAVQTNRHMESNNTGWKGHTPKVSETTPAAATAGDGTISVQDIVDRVISQTEVVAKQPILSQRADSKPLVSASGTFYPDRAPIDTSSHSSQQQRRETHKEDVPRETTGRRGRPRMRSPCPERREPAPAQEYMQVPPQAGHRGSGSVPGEDYLQSMQAALAKYGQVHPSHRMAPFLPTGMSTSASLTQGALSVASAQNTMVMGGLHPPPSSLQPRLHAPPHTPVSSQPPPLLRVDVMDRGELPHHQQPKPPLSHPPSRSCSCSSCSVFWAREREAERVRMVQQQQQPSPVDRGISRMPSHPPHPAYSKPLPAPSHSHKWPGPEVRPLEGRHLDTKQEKPHPHYPYPRSHEAYPASHPAYGIQTGVPVPHMPYADKPAPEIRYTEPHYPKAYERAEHAHRQAKPGYEETVRREMVSGRHPYPASLASGKPTAAPSHLQPHSHTHPSAHSMSGRKPDSPLLDLTYSRDIASSGPVYGEEEKPLDLSSKKPSSPAYFYERQDGRHRREEERRYDPGDASMDPYGRGGLLSDRGREGEKYMTASQHLHNLETSVESHFQKLQHGGHRGSIPLHNMGVSAAAQSYCGRMHPHGTTTGAGVPLQNFGVGRPQLNTGHGSSVPLPPHHPTLPPSHPSSAVGGSHPGYTPSLPPGPAYPTEPLLSPGGRRPQLHPIPPPNPSTTLGSAPPRSVPGFQSRTGSSSLPGSSMALGVSGSSVPLVAGVPAVMSAMPVANVSPMVSLPSSLPRATPPTVPVSSPQRSGSGGLSTVSSEYPRLSGSRSVSPPPGSDMRGEDRQRGTVSKHEPIHSILGNNNPQDILYLICRLCRQTYGSPYGFRKHFRNQHGFEPKAEHTLVQTISATKNARQMSGGITPTQDPESPSPSHENYAHHNIASTVDGVGHSAHPASPRSDIVRSVIAASPGGASLESMGDAQYAEGGNMAEHRHRNSFSRTSTDSKGRSPSGGSVGEEREDTKCLECPECGQTFQLNDFGSYKRHCRQHGQMKGVGREGGGSQGVYTCTECQCTFPEPHLLGEHMQRHQANPSIFTCPLCHTSLPSPADYQDHMRSAHPSSHEPTSSSSPITVGARAKVTSASSHCDSSSTSTAVRREVPSTSLADSSMSSFNLTVTTPSDLEICRLPADPIVTSASPDSSSDNKKTQDSTSDEKKVQDGSPVSSSEQVKMDVAKTEPSSLDSQKPASSEGTDSSRTTMDSKDSIKVKTDDKQIFLSAGVSSKCSSASIENSSSSSLDMDENAEVFTYKHKKFSAHRKRSASSISETSASEVKQACLDVNSPKPEKTQQNVVSSATEKLQTKLLDSKSKPVAEEVKPKAAPSKTEARHPLPFVWDRVTRSQAGKHARSSDYS